MRPLWTLELREGHLENGLAIVVSKGTPYRSILGRLLTESNGMPIVQRRHGLTRRALSTPVP